MFPKANTSYQDKHRNIIIPRTPSTALAEFIGILAGDGHVADHGVNNRNIIAICLNLKEEKEYVTYIRNLVSNLFNAQLWSKEYPAKTTIMIAIRSQAIFTFLTQTGFRKHHCIVTVPTWIHNNDDYLRAFIRGLFDTDGSIALKRNHGRHIHYPVVGITSIDPALIALVSRWATQHGIPHWQGVDKGVDKRWNKPYAHHQFQVNGYKNCTAWFTSVGTSNPKHQKKWERRDLNTRALRLQRSALPG